MRHWLKYSAVLALCIAGAIFAVGVYYKYGTKTPERLIQIPETNFSVILYGPDEKGHYSYAVFERTHVVATRFLGPITPTSTTATVSTQSDGIVRLDWGPDPSAGFVLLDFNERKVVRDSNSANMPNEPFLSIPAAPSSPRISEPQSGLIEFVLPISENFSNAANQALKTDGKDLSDYFEAQGIGFPEGSKVELDSTQKALAGSLPHQEAIHLIQLVYSWMEQPQEEIARSMFGSESGCFTRFPSVTGTFRIPDSAIPT